VPVAGIGEGIARAFADAGASVVLAARTACDVESVASSIRDQGGRAVALRADVTDTFALCSLATAAVEEFGHLDIWVNNAGGAAVGKPLAELKRSEWDEVSTSTSPRCGTARWPPSSRCTGARSSTSRRWQRSGRCRDGATMRRARRR
jgi:enoyl-[acyl-carrier-protein] reductase (NADH)